MNSGMKLIFLDTEFSDIHARDPKLVSIGLVTDTGAEEFYGELPRQHWGESPSMFFLEHVEPRLQGGSAVMERWKLAEELRAWLAGQGECVLLSDALEYDYRLLLELYGEFPEEVSPTPCRYFGQGSVIGDERLSGIYNDQYNARADHHALRDARSLRDTYRALLEAGWEGIRFMA